MLRVDDKVYVNIPSGCYCQWKGVSCLYLPIDTGKAKMLSVEYFSIISMGVLPFPPVFNIATESKEIRASSLLYVGKWITCFTLFIRKYLMS